MKIKMYRTMLTDERYPSLVAENGNYICDGRKRFDSPETIYEFCVKELEMDRLAEEYVYCFALDNKCQIMGLFEVSHGNVNTSVVSNREIFQKLLLLNAVSFILVHNHPSGDPMPSVQDIDTTAKAKQAGQLMSIDLLDHIIIGEASFFSLKENNYI